MTDYRPGDLLRLVATIRVTHVSRDGVALIGWLPNGDVVSLRMPQPGVTLTPLTAGATSPALPALPTPVANGDGQGTPLVPEPGRLHPVMPRPIQDPALATQDADVDPKLAALDRVLDVMDDWDRLSAALTTQDRGSDA